MQAARGASLSPGSDPGPATPHTTVRLFVVVALVAVALDQVTKVLAVDRLQGHDSITLVPGALSLTFLRNPGAAFSLGTSMTVVLSLVAIAVCVAVVKMSSRLRDRWWAVGLGLLLGGAVGNLADRLFREPAPMRGHVVDFIDYGGLFVGNVADIALTVAAVLIVWRTWRGVGLDGTREERA
jgi:signal peptidase II